MIFSNFLQLFDELINLLLTNIIRINDNKSLSSIVNSISVENMNHLTWVSLYTS